MGSAGHAFIAHTKALSPRAQCKDGYGAPPHPLFVRAGQRYWPRATRVRQVLRVRGVDRGRAVLAPDGRGARLIVATERLLRIRADRQGRNYQFLGFVPRRYSTAAYIWAIDGADALLSIPEWHPARPVRFPARLLPGDLRGDRTWLAVTCDLAASSPARLQLADLRVAAAPPPGTLHPPALDLRPRRV